MLLTPNRFIKPFIKNSKSFPLPPIHLSFACQHLAVSFLSTNVTRYTFKDKTGKMPTTKQNLYWL